MAGIYLHIPFCKQACHYCDFHFSTSLELKEKFVHALCCEIKLQKDYLKGEIITSIYFGGGTPSLLTEKELQLILHTLHTTFDLSNVEEITLEANPDDINIQSLTCWKNVGINRLSIGIQTFQKDALLFLNRAHNSDEALRSVEIAREVGFNAISIDLIYGIHTMHHDDLKKDLDIVEKLDLPHISAYSLTIEEKTVFGKWEKTGKLPRLDDDVVVEAYDIVTERLFEMGYEQYEISNYCKNEAYSKHNSAYWRDRKYLGLGPSAHSYNRISRQANIANNTKYIHSVSNGNNWFGYTPLSLSDYVNEQLLTGLRTKWGIDLSKLKEYSNYDLYDLKKNTIDNYIKEGMVYMESSVIKLTNKGRLLADSITEDLFI